MKAGKSDLRSQFTIALIEKALLKRMKIKKNKKITVSELCLEAGVTRATFYNHYSDVKDVYKQMEDKLYNQIMEQVKDLNISMINDNFFVDMLNIFIEKKDLVEQIVSTLHEDEFVARLSNTLRDMTRKQVRAIYPYLPSEIIDTYVVYTGYGIGGVIVGWLNSGFSGTVERVARSLSDYQKSSFKVLQSYADKEIF